MVTSSISIIFIDSVFEDAYRGRVCVCTFIGGECVLWVSKLYCVILKKITGNSGFQIAGKPSRWTASPTMNSAWKTNYWEQQMERWLILAYTAGRVWQFTPSSLQPAESALRITNYVSLPPASNGCSPSLAAWPGVYSSCARLRSAAYYRN